MTKLKLLECTQTCHWIDPITGEVVDTWEHSEVKERHIGCCNICVMRRPITGFPFYYLPGGEVCATGRML